LIPAGSTRITGEAIRAYLGTLVPSSSEGEFLQGSDALVVARDSRSEKFVPAISIGSRYFELSLTDPTTEAELPGRALRSIVTELPRITTPAPTTLIESDMPRDWDDEVASIDLALADWFVEPGMD